MGVSNGGSHVFVISVFHIILLVHTTLLVSISLNFGSMILISLIIFEDTSSCPKIVNFKLIKTIISSSSDFLSRRGYRVGHVTVTSEVLCPNSRTAGTCLACVSVRTTQQVISVTCAGMRHSTSPWTVNTGVQVGLHIILHKFNFLIYTMHMFYSLVPRTYSLGGFPS